MPQIDPAKVNKIVVGGGATPPPPKKPQQFINPATKGKWQAPRPMPFSARPRPRPAPAKKFDPARVDALRVQAYLPQRIVQQIKPVEQWPIGTHLLRQTTYLYQTSPAFQPQERAQRLPTQAGPLPAGAPETYLPQRLKGDYPTGQQAGPHPLPPLQQQYYQEGKPEAPPTTTGAWAALGSSAEYVQHRLGEAAEKVAGAGQAKYKEYEGLGSIFENIGQVPVLGKALTGLVQGGSLLLGLPSELSEQALGGLYYSEISPMKRTLGAEGDPVKEEAFQTAMRVAYSGPRAVHDAYQDALALAQQGQLNNENKDLVQARHSVWWKELVGQIVLDPLNILDVVTAGGKAIKGAKWLAGSEKLYTLPMKVGDDLADTADVLSAMRRASTTAEQAKQAETLLEKGLAYVNPRTTKTVIHKLGERTGQLVTNIAGTTNKAAVTEVIEAGLKAGTPEFAAAVTARSAERLQSTATLWAGMASDNLDDVKRSAEALGKLGFGTIPQSRMGRYTGVLLKEVMQKGSGEMGDLTETLNIAKTGGLTAENVAEQWYNKVATILEESTPKQKWETGLAQTIVQKTPIVGLSTKTRQAVDKFFSGMFLGMNPGYAMRNFYDNTARMLLNGYVPFKPVKDIAAEAGLKTVAVRSLTTQAETTKAILPATWMAEKFENMAGRQVIAQTYTDAVNNLWKTRLDQLNVPAEVRPLLRDMGKLPIDALESLAGKTVTIDWKLLPDDLVGAMDQASPHLHENVLKALYGSESPEDAIVKLTDMKRQAVEFLEKQTKTLKPQGATQDTLAGFIVQQAAQQVGGSTVDRIGKLAAEAEHKLMESRNMGLAALLKPITHENNAALMQNVDEVYRAVQQTIARQFMNEAAKVAAGTLSKQEYIKLTARIFKKQTAIFDDMVKALIETGRPIGVNAPPQVFGKLSTTTSEPLDALWQGATKAVSSLDDTIKHVLTVSQQPNVVGRVVDPNLLQELVKSYNETHVLASEMARRARDFVLLDYSDRRYFDPIIKFLYPWGYWSTRSIPNWAATIVTRPAMVAHYLKFKKELREYNDQDPSIPEWAKGQIPVRPPGYPGQLFWNFDAAFNAVQTLMDTYDDPEKEKDGFGKFVSAMSQGPAVHPLLVMAYAAERGLIHGDEEAMRSYGYLSGQTRGFANLTGATLEPWLWLKDPATGERIPFTGGASWDVSKAQRKLGYEAGKGRVGIEEAELGAATQAGPAFEKTLTEDIAQYRRLPLFLSMLTGLRFSPRQDWETELSQTSEQFTRLKEAGDKAGMQGLMDANPGMGAVWMSGNNEAERMKMLANTVLARIPPMPGEQRDELLLRAGMPPELMDQFYETTRGNPQALSEWDRRDYEAFTQGVLNLAEVLGVPDKKTAVEWQQAKKQSSEMYDALAKKHPNAQELQSTYFQLKAADENQARAFLEANPELSAYWQDLNHMMLERPLILKYYQEPAKVDSIAESLMYEEAERRWPGISQAQSEYYSLPKEEQRRYRLQHPELPAYWDWKKEGIKQIRSELENLRKYAGSSAGPVTIDYIVREKPNATQRAILNTLKDQEGVREAAQATPPPEEAPSKYSEAESEVFRHSDQASRSALEQYPDALDWEREYDQIKYVYGEDSAKLYAKQSGLYDYWNTILFNKTQDPILIKELDDDDLGRAANFMMRQEAEKRWPGIFDLSDQYYAIPANDRAKRREFRIDLHPELVEFWDWKEGAKAFIEARLQGRRQEARQRKVSGQAPSTATNQYLEAQPQTGEGATAEQVRDALRQAESGGDYTATNPKSSASGAYQYIDGSWANYGGYAHAKDAPPEVQDEKALADVTARFEKYGGDVKKVIASHYYPAWANNPEKWDESPVEGSPTINRYIDYVLRHLGEK